MATNKEMIALILENQQKFYSWDPSETVDEFQTFKCWHIQPYPQIKEEQCKNRAFKKYGVDAGCGNRCPRWRYYRKLAKKASEPKPIRIPYR